MSSWRRSASRGHLFAVDRACLGIMDSKPSPTVAPVCCLIQRAPPAAPTAASPVDEHVACAWTCCCCRDVALEGRNLFLFGCGGSGKSFWIAHMMELFEQAGKKVALAAMTGCAAELLGGETLHSILKLGAVSKAGAAGHALRGENVHLPGPVSPHALAPRSHACQPSPPCIAAPAPARLCPSRWATLWRESAAGSGPRGLACWMC